MADKDQNQNPDWLERNEGEPARNEDWMKGLSFEEDSAPSEDEDALGPSDADWLHPVESAPLPPGLAQADVTPASEDLPDWLGQVDPDAQTTQPPEDWRQDFEVAEPEPATPLETPEWLNALQPPAPSIPTPRAIPEADSEEDSDFEYGWIDSMIEEEEAGIRTPAPPMQEARPVAATGQPDDIDWESEFENAAEPATDIPEWLQELQPPGIIGFVAATEEMPQAVAGQPADWLEDIKPPDDLEDEPIAEPVMAAPQTPHESTEFDWRDDFEVAEDTEQPLRLTELPYGDGDEETVQAGVLRPVGHQPADNAPDWLNAMVPGVDLDYEAQEDTPIESDFIESPAREPVAVQPVQKQPKEFDWLTHIIDEETQPETQVAAAVVGVQQRFVFSRPPAWLRGRQAQVGSRSSRRDADWPSSAADSGDDFVMPDWLK